MTSSYSHCNVSHKYMYINVVYYTVYTQRNACRIGRRPTFRLVYPFPFLDGPPASHRNPFPSTSTALNSHSFSLLFPLQTLTRQILPPTPNLQLIFHCWFGLILFFCFRLIKKYKNKKIQKNKMAWNPLGSIHCASYFSRVCWRAPERTRGKWRRAAASLDTRIDQVAGEKKKRRRRKEPTGGKKNKKNRQRKE